MPCPNLRIEFCIVNQKLFSLAIMFNLIHIHIAPVQNTTKILSLHRYVCGFAGQRPQTPGGLGLIWLPNKQSTWQNAPNKVRVMNDHGQRLDKLDPLFRY